MPWAAVLMADRRRGAEWAAGGGAGQAGRRPPSREQADAAPVVAVMDVRGTEASGVACSSPKFQLQRRACSGRSPWQVSQQLGWQRIVSGRIADSVLEARGNRRAEDDLAPGNV